MTDKATRLAQRSGPALVERLRADELPAYTSVRDRPYAGGPPTVPCDPLDVVRLLAFCGVEEARGMVDCPCDAQPGDPCVCGGYVYLEEDEWVIDLQRLASKLPPKRIWKTAPAKRWVVNPSGWATTEHRDTPAETWLLAVAALAVAEECQRRWRPGGAAVSLAHQGRSQEREIAQALDACRAWVTEPTPERLDTWLRAEDPSLPSWALLGGIATADAAFRPRAVADALQAAAVFLTPERVRELASSAITRAVLG